MIQQIISRNQTNRYSANTKIRFCFLKYIYIYIYLWNIGKFWTWTLKKGNYRRWNLRMRRRLCGSNGFEGDGGGVGVRTSQLGPATPSCVRIRNIRPEILSHSFTLYSCTEKNNVKNKIFLKKNSKFIREIINFNFVFCRENSKPSLSQSLSLCFGLSGEAERKWRCCVIFLLVKVGASKGSTWRRFYTCQCHQPNATSAGGR